ncbi:hypothetical protein EVAR_28970_1 [Eumeta japonica]|uniref:Uncharacterized protein n=1 Tax=Eumeta variegata TaxID=151549 RepID=A0A4C1W0W4_EUMVA|nr:hypothetical protein EVAR_28970_1 [Eumeta japonica]
MQYSALKMELLAKQRPKRRGLTHTQVRDFEERREADVDAMSYDFEILSCAAAQYNHVNELKARVVFEPNGPQIRIKPEAKRGLRQRLQSRSQSKAKSIENF